MERPRFIDGNTSESQLKALDSEVCPGAILFLPAEYEVYMGVKHNVPETVKGHPVMILDKFPGGMTWFLIISSRASRIYDEKNPHHIKIYSGLDLPVKIDSDTEHKTCRQFCQLYVALMDGKEMFRRSYLNATHVYELPQKCFERGFGYAKKLRPCSFNFARAVAAQASVNAMYCSMLYNHNELRNALVLPAANAKSCKGKICWAKPANDLLRPLSGDAIKGGGPCLVMDVQDATVTVCMIIDNRPAQSCHWRFETMLTKYVMESRRKLFHHDLRRSLNSSREEVVADDTTTPATGNTGLALNFLPDHFVQCWPFFTIDHTELLALPNCYMMSRHFSHKGMDKVHRVHQLVEETYHTR